MYAYIQWMGWMWNVHLFGEMGGNLHPLSGMGGECTPAEWDGWTWTPAEWDGWRMNTRWVRWVGNEHWLNEKGRDLHLMVAMSGILPAKLVDEQVFSYQSGAPGRMTEVTSTMREGFSRKSQPNTCFVMFQSLHYCNVILSYCFIQLEQSALAKNYFYYLKVSYW